jgi:hypothetical protein
MVREAHAGHRPAGRAEVGGRSGLTLARKIDAILKLSVVASVLLASSSVGYYYLVHLPHQEAQFEPERVLERLREAAKKRAQQEQLLFEQQALQRRVVEQQAVEERQALEKANRHQACLSRATDNYNASRLAACNRAREKIIKDQDDCVNLGFSRKVCAMAHVVREASPNCTLPRTVALALDADVEKARDRCPEEDKDGSTVRAPLSGMQIETAGLGPVIVEPAEPPPIAPPPLQARAPSPKTVAIRTAPIARGAALTEPIPMPAVLPKAPASSSRPAAMPSAAAAPVVPHTSEAAAPEGKRFVAVQHAPTHAGWIVQIGAFDIEREAQQQLSSALAMASHMLDNADPFTEVVVKGERTLYRARFAGFQRKDEAEAVCEQLKFRDIDCITIKN